MKKQVVDRYINTETGEIFDKNQIAVEYKTVEDNYKVFKKTREYMTDNFGSYFHIYYSEVLNGNYEPQMITRFLKLCCKMNYSNKVMNGLTSHNEFEPTTKNLMELWNIGKAEVINTKKYLLENDLIYINDNDHIFINEYIAKKGETEVMEKCNKIITYNDVTRVFQSGYDELFNGVKASQHKKLYTFLQILPYVNLEYNIICDNPTEKEVKNIRPITWTELGRRIGLSEIATKRLRAELWNLQIYGSPAVGEFSTFACGKSIVINPNIYYKGCNRENLKGVGNLFNLKSSKKI